MRQEKHLSQFSPVVGKRLMFPLLPVFSLFSSRCFHLCPCSKTLLSNLPPRLLLPSFLSACPSKPGGMEVAHPVR